MNKQEKQIFTSDNLKETAIMTIAVGIIAAAVYFFLIPSMTSISSISALAIVMSHYIPLHVSTITMILNVVLLLIGFVTCGKEFGAKTVYTSILLPLYLAVFEHIFPDFTSLTNSSELDVICYILVVSIGLSILFNMNASSGGIDIVAKLINKYLGFKIGQSITIIGVLISMAAIFVYDRETKVISLVGTLIYGQVLDRFCDGFHVRKKVSILSKEHEKIQNYIVRELRRGATIYPAYGGLDHAEHVEVVTILEKNEYGKLLSFIHETDEHAFVTVSTVNEVVGDWNTVKSR